MRAGLESATVPFPEGSERAAPRFIARLVLPASFPISVPRRRQFAVLRAGFARARPAIAELSARLPLKPIFAFASSLFAPQISPTPAELLSIERAPTAERAIVAENVIEYVVVTSIAVVGPIDAAIPILKTHHAVAHPDERGGASRAARAPFSDFYSL